MQIYLVDDKLVTLYNAKTNIPRFLRFGLNAVLLPKIESLLNNFSPDATITNLKEIIPIHVGKFEKELQLKVAAAILHRFDRFI